MISLSLVVMPWLMQARIPLAFLLQQHTLHSLWAYCPLGPAGAFPQMYCEWVDPSAALPDYMLPRVTLLLVAPPVHPSLPTEFCSVYFPTWFVIIAEFCQHALEPHFHMKISHSVGPDTDPRETPPVTSCKFQRS